MVYEDVISNVKCYYLGAPFGRQTREILKHHLTVTLLFSGQANFPHEVEKSENLLGNSLLDFKPKNHEHLL